MNKWTSLDGASLRWKPYHQNTTRLMTTRQHLSILIDTEFPVAEHETALVSTY